jgi:predicted nucleic acid-binding protein
MTGPFELEQLERVENLLGGRIVPFGPVEAEGAAQLYNLAGRKREKRIDSFIAATAIFAKAKLATKNRKDFEPFLKNGLILV